MHAARGVTAFFGKGRILLRVWHNEARPNGGLAGREAPPHEGRRCPMTDLITEMIKLVTALVAFATAIVGLSAARKQRPRRKKKGHRR